jgi:hypothetical protein
MKVYEKENVKIVTVEMRAAGFCFLINNKRIIYKLKSINFIIIYKFTSYITTIKHTILTFTGRKLHLL